MADDTDTDEPDTDGKAARAHAEATLAIAYHEAGQNWHAFRLADPEGAERAVDDVVMEDDDADDAD